MIRLLLLFSITFMLAACVQVMSYDSTVQEEAEPVDSLLVLIAAQGYRSAINAEEAFCRRFVERSALDRCASATAKTDVGTEIDDTRLRQLAAEHSPSDANYFSRLGDRILKDLKEKNLIN